MNNRTKKIIEAFLFIILGTGLVVYSIYDSLNGTFYAGSKYGPGSTISITDGITEYWIAVGFRVLLAALSIGLGISTIRDIIKTKNPYD